MEKNIKLNVLSILYQKNKYQNRSFRYLVLIFNAEDGT